MESATGCSGAYPDRTCTLLELEQRVFQDAPFPHFTGVNAQRLNDGSSYFGLQARFEKRFSHGFQLLANYQFARTIESLSRLNDFGPIERRPSNIDRPHRFVISVSFDLPFGRGKAIGAGASPIIAGIIGGWVVNGIYSRESSRPAGGWGDVLYDGGPLNWDARGVDGAFDTARFNRKSRQQLSNHVRSFPT